MFDRLTPSLMSSLTPSMTRALSVFTMMLVLSAILVSTSYYYMDGISQNEQAAKRAMRIWQSKINKSVEKNQIIDTFETNFVRLVNRGVVGSEDRLSWFETIQETTERRGMPSVKYSISSQQPFIEDNLKKEFNGVDVYKSVMTLDIKMAHEGDLFVLFNDLRQANGLFAIDSCNIVKITKRSVDINNRMKAFCELGWYTFRGTNASQERKNAS